MYVLNIKFLQSFIMKLELQTIVLYKQ